MRAKKIHRCEEHAFAVSKRLLERPLRIFW